jgi:DNA helicase-2/ATP-dependent DNA helicase PcrA
MGLRKGQKELVEEYKSGFCAIPAIPGGGKTFSLTMWAVKIIEEQLHKPGKILIVTYMNSAVNNFKQRISKELEARNYLGKKEYLVCTIHSLCLQIVKEKPDIVNANQEFKIIETVLKEKLIQNAIYEWKKDNQELFLSFLDLNGKSVNTINKYQKSWHDKFIRVVSSGIGDFKIRGITAKDAVFLCSKLEKNSLLKIISEIYILYQRELNIKGCFDFDDMLYSAKKILEEDEVILQKYQKKYTFVCEDEAQDSNLIQSDILKLIANGNLLRVGDSNQAICGSFSNSDFTLFKEFCNSKETVVHRITQSSRNTKEIIELANYFVDYVIEKHPVKECKESLLPQFIETVDKDDPFKNPEIKGSGLRAQVYESQDLETSDLVKKVIYMTNKYPQKTIAILAPSAYKIKGIVELLEKYKVPFEQLDNTSYERNKTLRILGRIIDYIAFPENNQKFIAMFFECFLKNVEEDDFQFQQNQLEIFLRTARLEMILYPSTGEFNVLDISDELKQLNIWNEFIISLDLIRELLEFPATIVEKLILHISDKMNFGREEKAIAQKVASDIQFLIEENPNWQLADLALELLDSKSVFNYFTQLVWDLKGYEPKEGIVTVCTYHKSKGLEWDCVFLTGISQSDFPVLLTDKFTGEYYFLKKDYKNPQAIVKGELEEILDNNSSGDHIHKSKIEIISERTRLLYVGITRAREYLFLSGVGDNKKNIPSEYFSILKEYIYNN